MDMLRVLKDAGGFGPVFFGIGFIAPLVAQTMDAVGVAAPFGLPAIGVGLVVGVTLGSVAKWRGGWL